MKKVKEQKEEKEYKGWISKDDFTWYKGRLYGTQLLVVHFQKPKPNIFRNGKQSKMIKIKIKI